jgi:hypothetical protein
MQTGGSATGGSGDEFAEAQERLASLLIDKFAKMIEPLEQRMAKLEGGAPVKGEHQEGSKDATILDDHFRTPTSANFGELPDRRESFGRRTSFGTSRSSMGENDASSLSGAISATRLKQPEIKYSEDISVEHVIKFFDECLQYISNWEALPANKDKQFPDAENFPLSIMPREVATWICTTTELIFDMASMHQYSEETVHRLTEQKKWWKYQTGDSIRRLLVKARNENVANSVMLQRLHKISWKSSSPYSLNAYAKFSHDVAQELRFTEGGEFKYEAVDLKDFIISSFPDPKFQKELYSIYGHRGILKTSKFEPGMILERICQRIKCFMRENIEAEMNASAAHRREAKSKVNFVDSFFEADEGAEISGHNMSLHEHIQESVNAVMISPSNCAKIGVGKDGKLLCRFLAGEKATCTFKHPQSDMLLKGTGVSIDTSSSLPKSFGSAKKQSTPGRVHSIQADSRHDVDVDAEANLDDHE